MGTQKCTELLSKKDYEGLRIYCKVQSEKEPGNSIYKFYMAIAFIHLQKVAEAHKLLDALYQSERKPVYKIISSLAHIIEGNAEMGVADLNEAISRDEDVEELVLIFEICAGELLLSTGQAALKKAILKDKAKTAELVRTFFEELAANKELTPEDRIRLLNSLSVFDRLIQRL